MGRRGVTLDRVTERQVVATFRGGPLDGETRKINRAWLPLVRIPIPTPMTAMSDGDEALPGSAMRVAEYELVKILESNDPLTRLAYDALVELRWRKPPELRAAERRLNDERRQWGAGTVGFGEL